MAFITKQLGRPLRGDGHYKELVIGAGELARTDVLKVAGGWIHNIPITWRLVAGRIELTTSAVVANRYIMMSHGAWGFYSMGPVAASSSEIFTIGQAVQVAGSALYTETGGYLGISSEGLAIMGDEYLGFNLDTSQAGDAWQLRLLFKYDMLSKEQWEKLTII